MTDLYKIFVLEGRKKGRHQDGDSDPRAGVGDGR